LSFDLIIIQGFKSCLLAPEKPWHL